MTSNPELIVDRRARMPRFVGATEDAVDRLAQLTVLIVGVGSIGQRCALALARLGARRLILVDPSRFKPESLLTHEASPEDVGRPKASRTAERCRAVGPLTRVDAFDLPVQALRWADVLGADAAIMCTDRLSAELAVSQLCLRLSLPLLQASVYGEALVSQCRVLLHRSRSGSERTACLCCLWGREEWEQAEQERTFSCAGESAGPEPAPTNSVGSLCSLAADLAVLTLLRLHLGLGQPVSDSMLEHAALANRTTLTPIACNPRCPQDHSPWERLASPREPASSTPRSLVRLAGLPADPPGRLSLAVDGHEFIEAAACGCGRLETVKRFVPRGSDPGRCRACGLAMRAPAVFRHERLSGEHFLRLAHRSLERLGVAGAPAVLLGDGERSVLMTGPSLAEGGAS